MVTESARVKRPKWRTSILILDWADANKVESDMARTGISEDELGLDGKCRIRPSGNGCRYDVAQLDVYMSTAFKNGKDGACQSWIKPVQVEIA